MSKVVSLAQSLKASWAMGTGWKALILLAFLVAALVGADVARADGGYTFFTKWGALGSGDGQLNLPHGVAVDSAGNVYVADRGNHRVQKFSSTGAWLDKWGSQGSGDGQFNGVWGIAVDSQDNVYVVDDLLHRVQKFTNTGTFLTKWGTLGGGPGQFSTPVAVAVDSANNVYVTDLNNWRVQKFTSSGTYVAQWSVPDYPEGVAVDSAGNVYVGNGQAIIRKYSSAGTFVTQWIMQFPSWETHGVAVDALGNVYADELKTDKIYRYNGTGTLLTTWGSHGISDGQFHMPVGIGVGSNGKVYVADRDNHRIQVFAPPDPTPPVISSPIITGTLGNNDWYRSDVTVTWTISDTDSGIASPKSGVCTTTLTGETTGTPVTCTAINNYGMTNTASVTFKVDKSVAITGTITSQPDSNGWYHAPVTVHWQCSDDFSGLAEPCPPDSTLTQGGENVSVSASVSDFAGNKKTATTPPINITLENQPPFAPSEPKPADGKTHVAPGASLSWSGGDPDAGDTVTYTVFLGTSYPPTTPVPVCDGIVATSCDPPGSLLPGENYYWKVKATDSHGANTDGPDWNFRTEIAKPDLVPTDLSAPSSGWPWQTVSISWTVQNQGNGDALPAPSWDDRVYLSKDGTLHGTEPTLASATHTTTLAVGDGYTVTATVVLPGPSGLYCLILITDDPTQVAESDETNNQRSKCLTVGYPDLTPQGMHYPAFLLPWASAAISWTVKNQGPTDAVPAPSWGDRVYLSTDGVFHGTEPTLASATRTTTLVAGDSYTMNATVRLPETPGRYYLILIVDRWEQLPETNKINNQLVVPISVVSPDLTPTSLLAPVKAEIGTAIPLTWTIRNQGTGEALPTWYDRVYLSRDTIRDSGDVFLANITRTLSLGVGSSYTTSQSVVVPWVSPGSYYLLMRTDMWNNVIETDESNNERVVPIQVGIPDLAVTSFTAPPSAIAWQVITPSLSVKNLGHGEASPSWQDRIYLSADPTYDRGDTWLMTVTHGVTLSYNSSYTVTQSLVVPKVAPGNYYLLLLTDMWNQVSELDETNNVKALPIRLGPPDLTPVDFQIPAVAKPGQSIPLTWTVKNQGYSNVQPTWYDRVYFSTDEVYDTADTMLVNVTRTFTLLPGTSYNTSRVVNLPRVAPGTYYLILRTDQWGNVVETNEANNQSVVPITVGLADLTPTAFNVPSTGMRWQVVLATWTIKNQGPLDATGNWEDRVYLSTNSTWESGDIVLAKVTHTTPVVAGDSYTVSAPVNLPGTGTYYLILRTDVWGQLAEQDETNNTTAALVVVSP